MRMSKTPIKLKLPIKNPGSMPLAQQRRRLQEAARKTGRRDDEPKIDAALKRISKAKATIPTPI